MPRPRLIYDSPEELLDELITGKRTIRNAYILRYRALNLHNDLEQFSLIDTALKMYQASKCINDIEV